jgi:hypothetical protein
VFRRTARVRLGIALSSALLIPALPLTALSAAAAPEVPSTPTPDGVTVVEPGLPPGISLDDPSDTPSLREKAGVDGVPTTKDGSPKGSLGRAAAKYFPAGPSVIPGFSSHVAPACAGTGTDGRRVRVLYVREAADAPRLTALRSAFLNEIAQVDDLFAYASDAPGESRRVRWYSDSNCQPIIDEVVLPNGALSVGSSAGHDALISSLKGAGYSNPSHKYLVFAEGNRIGGNTCGLGNFFNDLRPGQENYNNGNGNVPATVARVDTVCWFSNNAQSTTTHELIHTFGAVQEGAPNATHYGHCHDDNDPMCYDDGSGMPMRQVCTQTGAALQLDCNKDDYFSIAPTPGSFLASNWNLANSAFLTKVATQTDPWDRVALSVNPSPAITGADASVAVSGTPSGTSVVFTTTTPYCSLAPTGTSSSFDILASLNCSSAIMPAGKTSTTVPVTAQLSHPDYTTTSRTMNVPVVLGPAPTPVLTAPTEIRANVPTTISATAPGASPLVWEWRLYNDDGKCTTTGATTSSVTITCPDSVVGTDLAVLADLRSADDQTGAGSVTLPVTDQYQTAVAITGPTDVLTGVEQTFSSNLSEVPPGATVSRSWSVTNGTIVGAANQETATVKPSGDGPGTLKVVAKVGTKTVQKTLDFTAKTPYSVSMSSTPGAAAAGGDVITFAATPHGGPPGAQSNYSWNLNSAALANDCHFEAVASGLFTGSCPTSYTGPVTATVTATSVAPGGGTDTASRTVQVTAVPFDVKFTQTPTGSVPNAKPGTFVVTSTVPAQMRWETTPAECTVGNQVATNQKEYTTTVVCPPAVSGKVDLKVTATENGGARTRTISSSMLVAEPPPAPPVVTGLTVTGSSSSTLAASWNRSLGADNYVLRYSTSPGGIGYTAQNLGNVTSTTLTGLYPGVTYYVSVVAQTGASSSAATAWVPAATAPAPPAPAPAPPAVQPVPKAPAGLKAKTRTSKTITPSWRRATYATKYVVYYGTKANGKSAKSKTVGNKTSVKLTGLKKNTKYYVRVVAVSSSGKKSNYSKMVAVKTKKK